MGTLPRISIITINLNYGHYLEEAIRSVLEQGYKNLDYIVIDGGSTDNSTEILKKYQDQLRWISEEDDGPVHALEKGIRMADGDVMGWINADDKLHPGSLDAIAKVFSSFDDVEWITGYPTWYAENGFVLHEHDFETRTVWEKRFYSPLMISRWSRWSIWRFLMEDYHTIQQESTFWRRRLWEKAGAGLNSDYKYAFDLELWTRFFQHAQLYTVMQLLGGFRYTGHQLSVQNKSDYLKEAETAIEILKRDVGEAMMKKALRKARNHQWLKRAFYLQLPWLSDYFVRLMEYPPLIRYDEKTGGYYKSNK